MASTICEKGRTNAHNSLKLTTLLVTKGHVESLIHLSNKGKYILSGNLRREHKTTINVKDYSETKSHAASISEH